MKRLAAAAAAVLLLALALLARPQPQAATGPQAPRTPATTPAGRLPAVPLPSPGVPSRNVFVYADVPAAPAAPLADAPPSLLASAEPTPTPPPLRLVGLVRRAEGLRAALALGGETTLVAAGDRIGRYTVVAVDEDSGVVVKDETGAEIRLPPGPS